MGAFVDSSSMIFKNIQHGLFLYFLEEHKKVANENLANELHETEEEAEKTDSFESILNCVTSLFHAAVLFPFSQPLMPYVLSKRKRLVILNPSEFLQYFRAKHISKTI